MSTTAFDTKLRSLAIALALSIAALFAIGCDPTTEASSLPTVSMHIGSKDFTLEIANTDATREKGLMQRDSMPADHGMIFVFKNEQPLRFWMKNTRFPLDILFLDAAGHIVSIHQMKAYDLTTTDSDGPSKYAIELNEGAATSAGVKRSDTLQIPAPATSPAD